MDESRKQFYEAFEVLTGWEVNDCPNRYVVRLCHQMWDMSRTAIEIELPPTVDGSNVPFAGNAWNAYRVEAVKAIRAAGIKVKE
ncbi:hypothetical protein [Enterobacter roggenkampii]|uniref:hypothetical protein n=1 Tax=Enterobacter roggenkampii TaxID=1812935 RepID=UPI0011B96FE5|nr:hypothetical protein [Enterobacter roggenkampii]TWY19394.1 hypothetical protein FR969_14630 [Enterobacter roggenkampii]